jgi:hypothetical protein
VAVGDVEKCPNIVRDFLVGMNTGKSHFSYIRVTPGDIGVALIHHACSLLVHGQCLRGYQCCMGSCRVVRTLGRPPLERFGTGGAPVGGIGTHAGAIQLSSWTSKDGDASTN